MIKHKHTKNSNNSLSLKDLNSNSKNKIVEVKEKLSFFYKGLICRIDLPVKPQAKGNNQALKPNIINQWKTVDQEVKKQKKR